MLCGFLINVIYPIDDDIKSEKKKKKKNNNKKKKKKTYIMKEKQYRQISCVHHFKTY
jgi:hypothetical protein